MTQEYDAPLSHWIYAGWKQSKTTPLVDLIKKDRPISNILTTTPNLGFINSLVDEQVTKMFSHGERPIVELILNAVDANPHGIGSYRVDITTHHGLLSKPIIAIRDEGDSMNLEEILNYLIAPFNTSKPDSPGQYIGRFGVGFFSSLRYCLERPEINKVVVETSKKGESFNATFYSTTKNSDSLRLKITRVPSTRKGTCVSIYRMFDPRSLEQYCKDEVRAILHAQAQIHFDGRLLNDNKQDWNQIQINHRFKDPRTQAPDQETYTLLGQELSESFIRLASLGVEVKRIPIASKIGMRLLFPKQVDVIIGRNGFDLSTTSSSRAYFACAGGAFRHLEQFIRAYAADHDLDGRRQDFVELAASLFGGLELKTPTDIPNIGTITGVLVPGKEYALLKDDADYLAPIISASLSRRILPVSGQAAAFWGRVLKQRAAFDHEQVCVLQTMRLEDINPGKPLYNFLASRKYGTLTKLLSWVNSGIITDTNISTVRLIEIEPGITPFLYAPASKEITINLKHPTTQGTWNLWKAMLLVSNYLQQPHVKTQYNGAIDYIHTQMVAIPWSKGGFI